MNLFFFSTFIVLMVGTVLTPPVTFHATPFRASAQRVALCTLFANAHPIDGFHTSANDNDDPAAVLGHSAGNDPFSQDVLTNGTVAGETETLPSDRLDNYGAVMEGFITPAQSGRYRFFLYSACSPLFLSTDDKDAGLAHVAEDPGCCNFFTQPGDHTRTSEPLALVAGTRCYVRFLYKEGGGGDYGQIAWRKEGDKTLRTSTMMVRAT